MNLRLAPTIAAVGIIIMVAFPKAGFYFRNVPITVGYLILALFGLFELAQKAIHRKRRFPPVFGYVGLLLFGFAVLQLAFFRIYGFKSTGVAISVLASTLAVPALAILSTQWVLRVMGIAGLIRCLRWSLLIVLVFGIVSFAAYNVSGAVVGIPYVTTTGGELAQVFARHNLRGGVVKMFSTYNNGNILGINLLMWGPIAAVGLRHSRSCAVGYRAVCLFTLSRSVWAGLLMFEVFGAMAEKSARRIYRAAAGAVLLVLAVVVASLLIGKDPAAFLLDKDLGGRVSNLQNDLDVLSTQRIGWDSESLYAAAYLAFGPIGLSLLLIIWAIPILVGGNTDLQRTARLAMLVYLVVASVEGAFTLVPTQAIYWSVAAIAMASRESLIAGGELPSHIAEARPLHQPLWDGTESRVAIDIPAVRETVS